MSYVFVCASVAAQLMSGFALLRCSGDGSRGWQFTIHMYKFQKKTSKKKEVHIIRGEVETWMITHTCARKEKKKKKDMLLLPSSLYTTTLKKKISVIKKKLFSVLTRSQCTISFRNPGGRLGRALFPERGEGRHKQMHRQI